MFKRRYRIVTDVFCGYEAQYKPWWSPVWIQMNFTNTHPSIEKAEAYIQRCMKDADLKNKAGRVVKYVEPKHENS